MLAAALSVPGVRQAHNVTVFQMNGSTEVTLHLKLPPTLTLAKGHAVAGQVEDAIRTAAPQVTAVQTHLEPFDQEVRAGPLAADLAERLASSVRSIVARIAGSEPRELRFVDSDLGIVGFVTLVDASASSVSCRERGFRLVRFDPGEEAVEVGAGERPVEGFGDAAVVVAEAV